MTIASDVASLSPGVLVELFDIDLTQFGSQIFYVTQNDYQTNTNNEIIWHGNHYQPMPIMAQGFESDATGKLPQPTLSISNVMGFGTYILSQMGTDPLGGVVTRWRTFSKYLDNQSEANPNNHFPIDRYIIGQKTQENRESIVYTLQTALDRPEKRIPARQVLKDNCSHIYRRYDPSTMQFDYTTATCPYRGAASYDIFGKKVPDNQDVCSKHFQSGCRIRFGNDPLPFQAFPAIINDVKRST